ncbi:MAG TPA: alanine--tRNA ligase [Armatimonadota bacterium]|jgi:alanyl-tRNA synthetase
MLSSEIREKYLKFFENKGCLIAPSDSLVPNDPTLLFTSAGMVQFKPYFIGERVPPRSKMTTSQKCLRTGDLDIVGTTPFHHTFFEMLGNFSFGDYFKEEAITWAWEFLMTELKFRPEQLWVTVYKDDDEAAELWEKKIGLPKERIVRLGEKSNYWPSNAPSQGPNGPCGPCSEIFIDFGEDVGCRKPDCGPDCDCARFSEIWNLVFMQYNREEGGVLTPLPRKNIDTGMGLERVTAVIQGTPSNFETDLFMPIIQKAVDISGAEYGKSKETDISLRVIADHARAMVFTITDGVMPSNVGRGYVLRRIIRRAVLKGKSLGLEEMFLDKLIPVVVGIMESQYPELREREDHITRIIRAEEEKFRRTLDMGLQKLEDAISRLAESGKTEIPGMEAFVLYDTYGFPLDLVQEQAIERGMTVDIQGFDEAMEEQRRRAREGSDISTDVFSGSLGALAEIEKVEPATEFVGYDSFECIAKVVGILKDGELVNSAAVGDVVNVVLDKTSFYPEGGGQVTDMGVITGANSDVKVESAARVGSLIVHLCHVKSGRLTTGDEVRAVVDTERRMSTMRNHTATHLLHRALRMMLGEHVVQSGSLVEPSRLRFDFTHFQAITPDELKEIEKIVNEVIFRDLEVKAYESTLEQAKSDGAMALFSEKYRGTVRVINTLGFSIELCGGTHVSRTSQIGLFKIISESSVGAGLRRIEAVTGSYALEHLLEQVRLLAEAAEVLKTTPAEVPEAAVRLNDNMRSVEKQIEDLRRKGAANKADELAAEAADFNGVKLVTARIQAMDVDQMSSLADSLADKLQSAVIVLGSPSDDKAIFVSKVTPDLVKRGFNAGAIVREVAKVAGGGGGGRPDFAQAGGKDAGKLEEALQKARELVEQKSKE